MFKKAKKYISKKIDRLFLMLLKRHMVRRMDQWERWHIQTQDQDFYVEIYRGEGDGHNYTTIDEKLF